jgi:hypothetical protein
MKMPSLTDMAVTALTVIVGVIAAGQMIGWVLTKYGTALGVLGVVAIALRLVWWWTDRHRF